MLMMPITAARPQGLLAFIVILSNYKTLRNLKTTIKQCHTNCILFNNNIIIYNIIIILKYPTENAYIFLVSPTVLCRVRSVWSGRASSANDCKIGVVWKLELVVAVIGVMLSDGKDVCTGIKLVDEERWTSCSSGILNSPTADPVSEEQGSDVGIDSRDEMFTPPKFEPPGFI